MTILIPSHTAVRVLISVLAATIISRKLVMIRRQHFLNSTLQPIAPVIPRSCTPVPTCPAVINPVNPQLARLSGYALNAPTTCSKSQFYGEYLHAFEDTFAHRDAENFPYEARLGHLAGGHNPDHTYNVAGWAFNESRTLEMEQEVFAKFKTDFNKNATDLFSGKPIAIVDLITTLIKFNQDTTPESPNLFESSKIQILQTKLFDLGLPRMEKYAEINAEKCRAANLKDANGNPLKQDAYPSAILTTGNATTNQSQRCE